MNSSGLTAIGRLTDALSRSATLSSVYHAALEALHEGLGVSRSSILLFDAEGVMRFVASSGLSDEYREAVTGHTPWRPDSRDARPITVPDVAADASLEPYAPVFAREGIRALGFFPLVYRDAVIGKFMLYFPEPHAFDDGEILLASTIAGQIAFGVARVRAETDLRRERDRATFLAEASERLSSSLEYVTTLEHVSQLAVRELADWCTIDVVEDGEIRRLAVSHRFPDTCADALQSMRAITASRQKSGGILNVIRTGEPLLARTMDWSWFDSSYSGDDEMRRILRQLGVESYITVPLVAHGQRLGAITLVSADRNRLYDEYDLELATELGRRAGYAIDNARHYREAQEANRAKDEFLITLSHELRTPMTATLGWAAMLKRDLAPDTFRVAIDTIEKSARAQAALIDDLLDVSRIVTGKLQLSFAPIALRPVVEAAVDALRPAASAKRIQIELALDDAPLVAGDAIRLQQVLSNVVSNAVKFTPAGGAVSVSLQGSDQHAVVVVSDNGTGIPRRFLPHVFDRFRQADSSTSRLHGGLGLGLAIVKSLVELHGGTVTAESEGEGRGATFTIALPLYVAATAVPDVAIGTVACAGALSRVLRRPG